MLLQTRSLFRSWLNRQFWTKVPAARRVRRIGAFEPLEDRTYLSGNFTKQQFADVLDHLEADLATQQAQINSAVDAGTTLLPVIGKSVSDLFGNSESPPSTKDINGILNSIRAGLQTTENFIRSGATTEYSASAIQQLIFSRLGDFIGNHDADPTVNANDVLITEFSPETNTLKIDIVLESHPVSQSEGIQFSLGLPGFPFEVNSGGEVGLDVWLVYNSLKFGLDHGQFYVDKDGTNHLEAHVETYYIAGQFDAQFGFMEVTVPEGQTPELKLCGSIDVQINNAGVVGTPVMNLDAFVSLPLETKPVTLLTEDFQLPGISGTLQLDWHLDSTQISAGRMELGTVAPHLKFLDVRIEFGGLLGDLVGPMLKFAKVGLYPLELINKVLELPIPGLSDVWELVFDKKLSVIEIAKLIDSIGVLPPPYSFIVKLVILGSELLDSFSTLTDGQMSQNLAEAYLPVGDIDFEKLTDTLSQLDDLRSYEKTWGDEPLKDYLGDANNKFELPGAGIRSILQQVGTQLADAVERVTPQGVQDGQAYQNAMGAFRDKLRSLGSTISLKFPIMTETKNSIIKFIVGQDFDFMTLAIDLRSVPLTSELPTLDGTVGPAGFNIDVGGDLTYDLLLKVGYDTAGIRSFLKGGNPFALFDGFNFDYNDPEHPGQHRPIVKFDGTATFFAGASVGLGPILEFGAGLEAFVRADDIELAFDDPNNDGHFRPFSEINNLFSLFKTKGTLSAGLSAGIFFKHITIDISWDDGVSIDIVKDYLVGPVDLISIPLIDLNSGSQSNPHNPYPAYLDAIRNAEQPPARIHITDASVTEGTELPPVQNVPGAPEIPNTPHDFTFRVYLDNPSNKEVSVSYLTVFGGTADASDFTSTFGVVTFAPGETEKLVTVHTIKDSSMEDDETFVVNLLNPVNGIIVDNMGLGTIYDDDVEAVYSEPLLGPYDPTWGGAGAQSVDLAPTLSNDGAGIGNTLLQDSNGRIIRLYADEGGFGDLVVERFNPNGQHDFTFGNDGVAGTPNLNEPANGKYFQYSGIASIYKSGPNQDKILAAGYLSAPGANPTVAFPAIVRWNADGTLDTSFGEYHSGLTGGNGFQIPDYARFTQTNPFFQPIQGMSVIESGPHAGKILVYAPGRTFSGPNNLQDVSDLEVMRLSAYGSLDETYGDNGILHLDLDGRAQVRLHELRVVSITPDGGFILGVDVGSHSEDSVVKVLPAGQMDLNFGVDGFAQLSIANGYVSRIQSIDVQIDGKIVVLGVPGGNLGQPFPTRAVVRLLPNGALDPSFNGTGYRLDRTYANGSPIGGNSLEDLVETGLDGRIYLADNTGLGVILERLNADGSRDTFFAPIANGAVSPTQALQVKSILPVANNSLFESLYSYRPAPNQHYVQSYATSKIDTQAADLSITIEPGEALIHWGTIATYNVTVMNNGDDSEFASWRINLPAEAEFISFEAPEGWVFSAPAAFTSGAVIATRRRLTTADGPQQFTLSVAYNGAMPVSIATTATASSRTRDANSANNSTTIVQTISGYPNGVENPNAYRDAVLAAGPAGYWRLGESNVGNNSTAVDSSGHGYNGRYAVAAPGRLTSGQPDALTTETDTAVTFAGIPGSGAEVILPQEPFGFPNSTTRTFEIWFKATGPGVILGQLGTSAPMSNPENGFSGYVPAVYVDTTGILRAEMLWNGTARQMVSSQSVIDNTYHHLAITDTGLGETMYLDGVAVSAITVGGPQAFNSNYTYYLGMGYAAGRPNVPGSNQFFYFQGSLDEAAIYPTVLSAATIAQHYVIGRGQDFGDGPESFGTARHLAAGPTLGVTRDLEIAPTYSLDSDADDNTNLSDEDGLIGTTQLMPGETGNIQVSVYHIAPNATAYLSAWIDFDNSGTYELSEAVTLAMPVTTPGVQTITFTVPEDFDEGIASRNVRLRISSTPVTSPNDAPTLKFGLNIQDRFPNVVKLTSMVDFGEGTDGPGDGSVLDRNGTNSNPFGLQGAGSLGNENYAAVWSGKIRIDADSMYRFMTRSDDGSVLYIDGQKIVDNNFFQGPTNRFGDVFLTAGLHDIMIGGFQGVFGAMFQASWQKITGIQLTPRVIIPSSVLYNDMAIPGTFVPGGLRGEYYSVPPSLISTDLLLPKTISIAAPIIDGEAEDYLVEFNGGQTTPSATLNATLINGNLTIEDGSAHGRANSLSIVVSAGNLIVTDLFEAFHNIPAAATLDASGQTMTIPVNLVTGTLTINTAGGSDRITIDSIDGPFNANLVIDGQAGSDLVRLTSALPFAPNRGLSISAESLETLATHVTTSGAGDITIVADKVAIDATSTIQALGSTIAIRPQTAGTPINLGSEVAGSLSLTDSELDHLSAATIAIGDHHAGTITVSALIQHSGDASFDVESSRDIVFGSNTGWATTNGSLSFTANQAGTSSGNFVGIDVSHANLNSIGSGNISLTGHGGDTGIGNIGVQVRDGSVISSNGSGQLTIVGTGGTGVSNSRGVQLAIAGTLITSVAGDIHITGHGGNSADLWNIGVWQFLGASIVATGNANVTIDGTAGTGTYDNNGVLFGGFGTVGAPLISVQNGNLSVTGHGSPAATQPWQRGIGVFSGTTIRSTGIGKIMLDGTGGVGLDSGRGVEMGEGASIVSSLGDISITGQGGPNRYGFGVWIQGGSYVESTGAARITITGTGGAGADGEGVIFHGFGAPTHVSSVDGDITITGLGGDPAVSGQFGHGIGVYDGSKLLSTGTAKIILNGAGATAGRGTDFRGVELGDNGTLIRSTSADILINGQGGLGAVGYGMAMYGGAAVEAQNGANIIINATGGDGNDGNGFIMFGDGISTHISSVDGDISLTGQGGDQTTSGRWTRGVAMFGGIVKSTGAGSITLDGTGGRAFAESRGVEILNGSLVSVKDGGVAITGHGGAGTAPSDTYNVGVWIGNAIVETTGTTVGTGRISIDGVGGIGSGSDMGVWLTDGAAVRTSVGDIALTGRGAASLISAASNYGVKVQSGSVIRSHSSGNITLIGDSINIDSAQNPGLVETGSGSVAIHPQTAGISINLGEDDSPGVLGLTLDEIYRVFADNLAIGNATTGSLTVSDDLELDTNLQLISGNAIVLDSQVDLDVFSLELTSGEAGIQPVGGGFDIHADSTLLNGNLAIQIDGTEPDDTYSQLKASGFINLNGVGLTLSGDYTPVEGDTFTIVNNASFDPIIGTFAGLNEGDLITFNGVTLAISYEGGTGNDVVLTTVVVVTEADIGVTISPVNASAFPGDEQAVTFAVTNYGPAPSGHVLVRLHPPLESRIAPDESTGGHLDGSIWEFTSIPVGVTYYYTFHVLIPGTSAADPGNAGLVEPLSAAVEFAASDDPVVENNSFATTLSIIRPESDLAVTAAVDKSTALPGEDVTFTYTITNNGPYVATNVQFKVDKPLDNSMTAEVDGGVYGHPYWRMSSIPVGATYTLKLHGTPIAVMAGTTRTGFIDQEELQWFDPISTNNTASASLDVIAPRSDLAVTAAVDRPTALPGENVTFTFTVTNNGPQPATHVDFKVIEPFIGMTADSSGGAYSNPYWGFSSIPVGATYTLTVQGSPVTGMVGQTRTATIYVYGMDWSDPIATNDTASVSVDVLTNVSQSITFAPIGTRNYGETPFDLSATSDSGLEVSFRVVSGPATVDGKSLTLTGAGAVVVEATQAGSPAYLPAIPVQQTFTVNRKLLSVGTTGVSREYNGTTAATVNYSIFGLINGDAVTASGSATFNNKSVGTGKPINVTAISLSGEDVNNYFLANPTATAVADITPLVLTPTVTVANRIYNGTTNATILSRALPGVIGSEVVRITGGTATFDTKDAGSSKLVTITGLILSGTHAANYVLSPVVTTTAEITPKTTAAVINIASKIYDGTTDATIVNRVLSNVLGVDQGLVSLGTSGVAQFADKNAGPGKLVTVTGLVLEGSAASNYVLGTVTVRAANITPKTLTGVVTIQDKVYDGTTDATIAQRTLNPGVIEGEIVTLEGGTATFAAPTAGANRSVAVSGLTLAGTDSANYKLGSVTVVRPTILRATLTAEVTVEATRVFNGLTRATILTRTLSGMIGTDVVSLGTSGIANYEDKNVGTDKLVTITSLTLTGAAAVNYRLASTTVTTTASITPKELTASIRVQATRVYDGTNLATIISRSLIGFATGDSASTVNLGTTGVATFDNKNVGISKTVTVTGLVLQGSGASNYVIGPITVNTASITVKALTAVVTVNNKAYDGTRAATIDTRTLNGVIAGDSVTLGNSGIATFSSAAIGNNKVVTITNLSLFGDDAGNYAVNPTTTTRANIVP